MSSDRPNWLFDESVQVGVDYTDEKIVSDYDKHHQGFRNFDQEAGKIVSALDLSAASTILDIGCGTGGLTTHLARMCRHVYAVDVSETMIAVLKGKIQSQELRNVTVRQSGFLTYQHQGDPLDAVIANITLHHLPDFWKQIALCKFFDILKPGGRLFLADVVFDFDPRTYEREIKSWITEMREIAGPDMADETATHVQCEFSTWKWIMEGMLKRAGFRIDSALEIMKHTPVFICSK